MSSKQFDETPDTSRFPNVFVEFPYLESKQLLLASAGVREGSWAKLSSCLGLAAVKTSGLLNIDR